MATGINMLSLGVWSSVYAYDLVCLVLVPGYTSCHQYYPLASGISMLSLGDECSLMPMTWCVWWFVGAMPVFPLLRNGQS